jgi:hypothetical protein
MIGLSALKPTAFERYHVLKLQLNAYSPGTAAISSI